MRTNFTPVQLTDPHIVEAEKNLRACVHCGICTATCLTYVLLGDERDGPRGRIVLIQNMLEAGGIPDQQTVLHIDRCLSCLSCRTACPSGVDYARLVDEARVHIQTYYRRPPGDTLLRWLIATVLPRPALARAALALAHLFAPITFLMPGRLRHMMRMGASTKPVQRFVQPRAILANPRRIALMPGCIQPVIAPDIDNAVTRLLARRNIELVPLEGAGCCGALVHHLGRSEDAKNWARRAIEAFERAGGSAAFEGVLITATGCSSYLKDLSHFFLDDPLWLPRAKAFAQCARDLLDLLDIPNQQPARHISVAWHAACSLRNGLNLPGKAEELLKAKGFDVLTIEDGHLCCGSAGSYAILQPEIAQALRTQKLESIERLTPDIVATSNIGCLQHLTGALSAPIIHLAELLDWAEGGALPVALRDSAR